MQNSAHFCKNGVSNLAREGTNVFASNLVHIYRKKGIFSAHWRRETE